MAAGKIPPGMEMLGKGLGVTRERPPSASRDTTYGEWPDATSRVQVPGQGSLAGDHTVQGSCTVPKEVIDASRQAFLQMAAYGEEANFVDPPWPKDPKVTWNQEWSAKVRYRSAIGVLLGMKIPGMGGDDGGRRGGYRRQDQQGPDARRQQPQTPEDAKAPGKAILKGLGGVLGLPN